MDELSGFVLAYLGRAIDLDTFLHWLADAVSPVVGRDFGQRASALLGEIELRAAELTGGYINEARFREVLSEITGLRPHIYVYHVGDSRIIQTSSSPAELVQVERQAVYA